jgi:hypothetical protein
MVHSNFHRLPNRYFFILLLPAFIISVIVALVKNEYSRVGFRALSVTGTGSCPVNEKFKLAVRFSHPAATKGRAYLLIVALVFATTKKRR